MLLRKNTLIHPTTSCKSLSSQCLAIPVIFCLLAAQTDLQKIRTSESFHWKRARTEWAEILKMHCRPLSHVCCMFLFLLCVTLISQQIQTRQSSLLCAFPFSFLKIHLRRQVAMHRAPSPLQLSVEGAWAQVSLSPRAEESETCSLKLGEYNLLAPQKKMDGTFGFITFLLHGQEARQPGRRVHSSKMTLLVRWGRSGEEVFTKGWRHDKERENSLERARKTALMKNCTVCCYCPWGWEEEKTAVDQSVINTVI